MRIHPPALVAVTVTNTYIQHDSLTLVQAEEFVVIKYIWLYSVHTIYMHVSSSLMSVLASQVSMQGKQVWDFDNF